MKGAQGASNSSQEYCLLRTVKTWKLFTICSIFLDNYRQSSLGTPNAMSRKIFRMLVACLPDFGLHVTTEAGDLGGNPGGLSWGKFKLLWQPLVTCVWSVLGPPVVKLAELMQSLVLCEKMQAEMFTFFFTRMESTVFFLRLVFAYNKWTVVMVVLMRWCFHACAVVLVNFVQQLRKTAAAAKINAKLVEQSTVNEVMLLCHYEQGWREGEKEKKREQSS